MDAKEVTVKEITCFTIAAMGMPMFSVPDLIDEVQETQDLQLYIIEPYFK